MKSNFLKCFIIWAVVMTACVLAGSQGLVLKVLQNDASYICAIIMAIYVPVSVYLLWTARQFDLRQDHTWLSRRMEHIEYVAQTFMGLGLLGTLIGFCVMMDTALGTRSVTPDVNLIVKQLYSGCCTALYTTIIGMGAAMPLALQRHLLLHTNHE
jgi:uncharacterized membrane protein YfcA